MAKANLKKKLQFWGTGRRKKAIARVRLIPAGSGNIVINDRSLEDYFPQGTMQYIVKQPIVLTQTESAYDIVVNVCKKKHLTAIRSAGADEALRLVPPIRFSLEEAIEYIADDELIEVTPKNIRLRKRILDNAQRMKLKMKNK